MGRPAIAVAERAPRLKAPAAIQTDRLVLRRPLPTDAAAMFARYAADPAVTRFLGWQTHRSIADSQMFLACCDFEWRETGVGSYLIQSRETGDLLGCIGLRLASPGEGATGYLLARDAWGHGYATEGLRAMRDLALGLGLRRLHGVCHPEHRASWRVMEKCGFTREGILPAHTQFPNLAPGVAADVVCYAASFDTGWQSLDF